MTKYHIFSKMFSQSTNAVFVRVTAHSTVSYDGKTEKSSGLWRCFWCINNILIYMTCMTTTVFIAKLEAYGFQTDALNLVYYYLSNRKQRVKINETFSYWKDIEYGLPQGLVHYYLIYIYVTFFTSLKI